MSKPLILKDFQNDSLELKPSPEALKLRDEALSGSLLIAKVGDVGENEVASAAMVEIVRVMDLFEKARKEAKNPLLLAGRKLDQTISQLCEELEKERDRLAALIGDWFQLQEAKRKAAINSTNANLSELERQREQALSECKTHEELDAVHQQFDEKAAEATGAIPEPVRAKGQRVSHPWSITVEDHKLLARVHPDCVRIIPKLQEITDLLNQGVHVAGVKAERVTKVGVVKPRETKAIDI